MSKAFDNVMLAYDKGYRVDKDGDVWFNDKRRSTVLDRYGRPTFTIRDGNNKPRTVRVHRLVAYQIWGEESFKHETVRHLDGNPANNKPNNLELGTQQQNMLDRSPEDLLEHSRMAASYQRKFSKERLANFWEDRNKGMSLHELSIKYKIAKSTASYIVNRKTYKDDHDR